MNIRLVIGLLGLTLAQSCTVGCNTLQPSALPREYADVARAVATSVTDQALWEKIAANIDGQVIDPGIEGGAGVMYIAYGKLRGVSGQISLRGDGTGSQEPSPEAKEAIRKILLGRPDLADQVIAVLESTRATTQPVPVQP